MPRLIPAALSGWSLLAPVTFALVISCSTLRAEDGFETLFDGQSLSGWTGATDGYAVEDGALTCIAERGGNLYTEKEYSDFILRFEFRLPPGGNNGIGLRVPSGGHASRDGMEIQILDNTAKRYANLKPYQYHGSVYGVIPAKRGYLKPVGTWNSQEIRLIGQHITVILNGEVIVDGDLDKASAGGTLDGKEHPGLKRASGHISLAGHGSRVQFRNIRVQEVAGETP
ncbi:hypothetical protein Mal4_21250 [Maioricimonas rarisocia]|uniref:3-keto-alpha-glucoside-1,2-lyase/3-keto-2-hydroxy-glucal hydratase domain-containing protein n=1 Tax=Maioricimonas rarisocia TaxID=2528026 RepID=A0A517Z5N5_9PLAN|nr:DUF1080 domain-containing protein [Maioricimonas rarisocia]QDU37808.1 hypothetical protein Mal4_21250 [Maioricimonas rarisocia]